MAQTQVDWSISMATDSCSYGCGWTGRSSIIGARREQQDTQENYSIIIDSIDNTYAGPVRFLAQRSCPAPDKSK